MSTRSPSAAASAATSPAGCRRRAAPRRAAAVRRDRTGQQRPGRVAYPAGAGQAGRQQLVPGDQRSHPGQGMDEQLVVAERGGQPERGGPQRRAAARIGRGPGTPPRVRRTWRPRGGAAVSSSPAARPPRAARRRRRRPAPARRWPPRRPRRRRARAAAGRRPAPARRPATARGRGPPSRPSRRVERGQRDERPERLGERAAPAASSGRSTAGRAPAASQARRRASDQGVSTPRPYVRADVSPAPPGPGRRGGQGGPGPGSPGRDPGRAGWVPTGGGPVDELPLSGYTVAVTAARRREELTGLLERRGARVVEAPAIRIVPTGDDEQLLAATRACLVAAPDVVVATTGIGFRGWMEAADGWGLGEQLRERFASSELLARGPKAKRRGPGGRPERGVGARQRVDRRGAGATCSTRASPAGAWWCSCTASRCRSSARRCARPARRCSRSRSTGGCRRRTCARCAGWSTQLCAGQVDCLTFTSAPGRRLAAARRRAAGPRRGAARRAAGPGPRRLRRPGHRGPAGAPGRPGRAAGPVPARRAGAHRRGGAAGPSVTLPDRRARLPAGGADLADGPRRVGRQHRARSAAGAPAGRSPARRAAPERLAARDADGDDDGRPLRGRTARTPAVRRPASKPPIWCTDSPSAAACTRQVRRRPVPRRAGPQG